MPEFDTYKVIERYAKNNDSPEAYLGYQFLKHRTQAAIMWRTSITEFDIGSALSAYLGLKDKLGGRGMADMSEEERKQMYDEMCREAGIQLDPKTFTSK